MADDMRRRREIAAAAFAMRRGALGLTQEDVAHRADVVVKTISSFEGHRRWPSARTRAGLERAVEWPPGEIERLSSGETASNETLLAALDRLQAELDQLREQYGQQTQGSNGERAG